MSSETIKALGFYQPGDKSEAPTFKSVDLERPVPTGRDLLVEVKAVSVNPTDVRTRDSKNDSDDSLTIVGRDVAGVVVETGEACTLFKPGDEVFYAGANDRPGGHSELHLVDERITGQKPENLNFPQAAALPLTSLTSLEALFDRLDISKTPAENKGKSILIIGAAGGVGSIATQIAKLIGLTVIGTASRAESIKWTQEQGADHVINHQESFEPQLKELGIESVDYIFCLTHVDDHMADMAKAIKAQGKICSILPIQKPLDSLLFMKSVTFAYELMFTRSFFHTEDMITQHHYLNDLAKWIESGKIQSTIQEHFTTINPETLNHAYHNLMSGRTIGKIVLEGPFEE